MGKVIEWLKGKKTYLVAAGIGIVVALQQAQVIDPELAGTILTFMGAGGLAALRAGMKS